MRTRPSHWLNKAVIMTDIRIAKAGEASAEVTGINTRRYPPVNIEPNDHQAANISLSDEYY